MKLPNVENALVEERKITTYLLVDENSGGKAAFFTAFGFTTAQWKTLSDALLHHAATHDITNISETTHGRKYIIEGKLQAPDGRSPQVRVIWIVDAGYTAPRLVTAYPLERKTT